MTDLTLTERLRANAYNGTIRDSLNHRGSLMKSAADRIEALEALVGEMAGALEVYADPSHGCLSTATLRAALAKHREVMG